MAVERERLSKPKKPKGKNKHRGAPIVGYFYDRKGQPMNLQTHIKPELWLAIQATYEAHNYTGSILDAIHHLSNVLRDKTGADGDGQALVGQALSGDSPRLRINKLQTETERNTQKGLESILRGIYQAIRNPRSHEQIDDDQSTADAVIYFIDYLLGIIQKSQEPFVMKAFVARVFDPYFVKSQQYAELLVNEIPSNKRLDTLIDIYNDKLKGDIYCLELVVHALLNKLSESELKQYMEIVSTEITTINTYQDFQYNMNLLPPKLWGQLSDISALRAENRMLSELRTGEYENGTCKTGALATWARDHFQYFRLRDQVAATLIEKLEGNDQSQKEYILACFLPQLPNILNSYHVRRCIAAISKEIRQNNVRVRSYLVSQISGLPLEWQHSFAKFLEDLTDEDSPLVYLADGTPFLASKQYHELNVSEETPPEPEFIEDIFLAPELDELPEEPEFDEELPFERSSKQ